MARRSRVFSVLCATLLTLASAPLSAAPAKPATPSVLNAKQFSLSNGMTVLLLEDHSTPFVEVQLTFDVGSADDPPHSPGASAMLTELLKHTSTRHVQEADRYGLIESFGVHPWDVVVGSGEDKTWIRSLVPSHALELALFLESDRMGYFSDGIDAAAVNRARQVLRDKAGPSWADSLRAVAYAVEGELFGPKHAYGTRWSAADLGGFTASDLRIRARKRYAPNRAVLTLAGDIGVQRAKELAQRYFGTLARGDAPADRPHESRSGRITFELTSKTKELGVVYGWRTPVYLTDADYALDGVARVLRRRLIDRLITPGIAKTIYARQQSYTLASAFVITAVPTDAHGVDEIVGVIDRELESLQSSPIPAEELQSAKDWLCLGIVDSNVESRGRASLATSFWHQIRDPNGYSTYLGRYRALSAEDLRSAARKHLGKTPHVLAIRRRTNEEKDMPVHESPKVPKGKGDARGVPKDEDIRLTPPDVQAPSAFQPPTVDDIRLASGSRALLHENHDFPRIKLRLIVDLGPKPTLASAWYAARLLYDAELRSGKTLRQALLDHGSELSTTSDLRTLHLTVSLLPEHFETVSQLLVEAVAQGKLRAGDFEAMQKKYRTVDELSLSSRIGVWADEVSFTPKSGLRMAYSNVDASWKNVKLADIQRLLSKLAAAQLTFALDGDVTSREAQRVLEAATRGLGKEKRERLAPVRLNTGIFLIDDPKAERVALRITAQMPAWSDGDAAPGLALRWFFGTHPSVTLNLVDRFREARVSQYQNDSVNVHHQPQFSIFLFDIEAPASEIPKITSAVLQQMQRLREGRIPAAAVAQSRREWQTSLREDLSDSSRVLGWLTTIAVHDEDSNLMTAAYRRSQLFGHDELVRVANARLVPENLAIIVLGDVSTIRPELEKLGLPIQYKKATAR